MPISTPLCNPLVPKVDGCTSAFKGVHLTLVRPDRLHNESGVDFLTDTALFKQELVQLLPRLRRFALTLTRSKDDGDDLVQIVCERAILRRAQWQVGSKLDSWLYTIMRNLWMSELRSRHVRDGRGHVPAAESDELATHISAPDHYYGSELLAMIMTMPDGLSSTLLLVAVEGHSYQEAAEILDIPIGTVMSRMSRARQIMKEKLILTGELLSK